MLSDARIGEDAGLHSTHSFPRLLAVSLIAASLDLLVFAALRGQNVDPLTAQFFGFAASAVFSAACFGGTPLSVANATASTMPRHMMWSGFVLVQVIALAIRGGMLGVELSALGLSPRVAIGPAVLAGATISYFGQAHLLLRRSFGTGRLAPIAVATILALFVLRLLYLGLIDLLPEEAYYWNYSQHLDIGYLDHPPMVAWLIWAGTWLFGVNEFGVRIGAFLGWLVTAGFASLLTRNLFGRQAALVCGVLIAAMPVYFLSGFLMMPDAPLTAAWAGTLYFLERALIGNRRWAWPAAGVCFGLGLLSKYTIALLGPAALLFILLDARSRRWLLRPDPYAAAVIALVLFSPVIYWNATHDWMSFAFQSSHRLEEVRHFSLLELLGYAAVLLTPTGLLAAFVVLTSDGIAAFSRAYPRDSKRLFSLVFTLVPLCVFVGFSLFHETKPNWTGPLWLSILPGVAAAFVYQREKERRIVGLLRAAGPPTVGITVAVLAIIFHYIALGFPGVGYRHNIRTLPVAWSEFGGAVAGLEQAVESQSDKPVVLIGMDQYFVASEMAFYVRPDGIPAVNSIGRGAIGTGSLMYDIWFPPSFSSGKTALMVSLGKGELERPDLASRFSRLTDIRKQIVEKRGREIGSFYYRVGYDLRTCSPSDGDCGTPDSE